ncbi:MAG: sulfurtransferase [Gemmataceae bacterium]
MLTQMLLSMLVVMTPGFDAGKQKGYPNGKVLVEAEELKRLVAKVKQEPVLHVLDARSKKAYQKDHVQGARWADVKGLSKLSLQWHDESRIQPLFSYPKKSRIVVYDDGSIASAARLWWLLRYMGFTNVQLLNGGYPAYTKAGGKTNDASILESTFSGEQALDRQVLATKKDVLGVLKTKKAQIIDSRSEGEFCGTVKKAKRSGSIPGAINLDWVELLEKKTKKFKSPSELSQLFQKAGIDLKKPLITHCQSGGRASVMMFALELMGAKQVKNYYRGWSEWGNEEDTPVVRPKR